MGRVLGLYNSTIHSTAAMSALISLSAIIALGGSAHGNPEDHAMDNPVEPDAIVVEIAEDAGHVAAGPSYSLFSSKLTKDDCPCDAYGHVALAADLLLGLSTRSAVPPTISPRLSLALFEKSVWDKGLELGVGASAGTRSRLDADHRTTAVGGFLLGVRTQGKIETTLRITTTGEDLADHIRSWPYVDGPHAFLSYSLSVRFER